MEKKLIYLFFPAKTKPNAGADLGGGGGWALGRTPSFRDSTPANPKSPPFGTF